MNMKKNVLRQANKKKKNQTTIIHINVYLNKQLTKSDFLAWPTQYGNFHCCH